jgi:hypothetical protein
MVSIKSAAKLWELAPKIKQLKLDSLPFYTEHTALVFILKVFSVIAMLSQLMNAERHDMNDELQMMEGSGRGTFQYIIPALSWTNQWKLKINHSQDTLSSG